MFDVLLYTFRDFIPPAVIITTTVMNPIIKAVSNSTHAGMCHDNTNEIMLNSVMVVLLIFASALWTFAASLGLLIKPYFRYNLEGKMEWMYANVLGGIIQFCLQLFWILLSREEPLCCWVKMDSIIFHEWQAVAFIFIGGVLFGIIYMLNRNTLITPIRSYENIR